MIKDIPPGLISSVKNVLKTSSEQIKVQEQKDLERLNKVKQDTDAIMEKLIGKQHKLDKNKNKKIDAHDFALLRKEESKESEQIDELSKKTLRSYMAKAVGNKTAHDYGVGAAVAHGLDDFKNKYLEKSKRRSDGLIRAIVKTTKEEVEQIDELSQEKMTSYMRAAKKDINKNLRGGEPEPGSKRDMKVKKRVDGYRKAWAKVERQNEEVEMIGEGKRLISKHGNGVHTAKVYKDTEYNEYQVHFFKDGKHMGEGPVSYHDDKEDAQNTADHALKKMNEEKDTPGNSYSHQCAVHVKHGKLGEGKTLFSQHAEPDADGHIAWYDVMFDEGIKRINTDELEILVSEAHKSHKKM